MDAIFTADCRTGVESAGMPLLVAQRGWAAGTTIEQIDAGLPAERVTLTTDGRHAITGEWHTGESDAQVYVERWSALAGREFHGWIDATSRRLVQSG